MDLSTAPREVIWLRNLARDVGLIAKGVVCLNCYSKTAVQEAQEVLLKEAPDNIAIYYYFIREKL